MSAVRLVADHLSAALRVQSTDPPTCSASGTIPAAASGAWCWSSRIAVDGRRCSRCWCRWILPDLLLLDTDHWLPLAACAASAVVFMGLAVAGSGLRAAGGAAARRPAAGGADRVPPARGRCSPISIPAARGILLLRVYELLPFVVVAGLAVFPLTVLETLLYALPIFMAYLYGVHINGEFRFAENVGTLWLLLLVTGAAMVSSLSQLRYMIALVRRASADTLTGRWNRAAGEETLELLFGMAVARGEGRWR